MKKIFLLNLLSILFAVNITFQVDMQNEDSFENVYIADWTSFKFHLMDNIEGTSIYSIILDLPQDQIFNYRYATENTFNPGTLEEFTRELNVPAIDTVLDAFCYQSELECPENTLFPVTISFIDGSQNWDNIWFQGSFDNWESSYQAIVSENVWTLELELSQGEYEWGAFQALNDQGDQEVWLTPNFPNPVFSIDVNGNVTGDTTYELVAFPVEFQIIDQTASLDSIYIKLGSSDFSYPNWGVNNYCEDNNSNWLCTIYLQPSELIYWKAYEGSGSDLNYIAGIDGNQEFSVSSLGVYDPTLTTLEISDVGEWITNTVRFEVDMTEWLDQDGANGIPIFSVVRNDEVQVRGDWNGWSDGDVSQSVMVRQPGSNIFSLPIEISYFSGAEYNYKFFIKHSDESVDTLNARYGVLDTLMSINNWGWENAPLYGGGNRKFQLSQDQSFITVKEGYYDLPPGGVIPEGTSLSLTYQVDISNEALFSGDSVRLVLKDKWTNYIQGFENVSVDDDNLEARFDAMCSSSQCSAVTELNGPFPYFTLYNWEYKSSDGDWITEGGAYGTYGKYRARYILPNQSFEWVDYTFPLDIFQQFPPYEPESMPVIGCTQNDACNYDEMALIDDGTCINFIDCLGDCGGDAIIDECGICNGDGSSCLSDEEFGCMDETACNYDETALADDDSCQYPEVNFNCEGNCILELDCNDVCGGIDFSCLSSSDLLLPTEFNVSSVYPNPFNPHCKFTITNPEYTKVDISIYDIRGSLVEKLHNGFLSPGYHDFQWNAENHQSGIYFIAINRKMQKTILRTSLVK